MCLIIEKGTNKRKAKADILVYKCLDENNGSYFTPFQHFHVFFEDGKCVLKVKHFSFKKIKNETVVETGIHSYYNKWFAHDIVVRFHELHGTEKHCAIIPKGASYYIGYYGEIVSNELIVFETEQDYKEYVKTSEKICTFFAGNLIKVLDCVPK